MWERAKKAALFFSSSSSILFSHFWIALIAKGERERAEKIGGGRKEGRIIKWVAASAAAAAAAAAASGFAELGPFQK